MKKTLNFILSGASVKRFHTVETLHTETVGHHSHGVAMLVLLLDPDASKSLLQAALFHDLSEHITGDIPSPAKRSYGISTQVDDLEERLMYDAGIVFPFLSNSEKRILKLADIAHGALFCIKEMALGNSTMKSIFDTYMSYGRKKILTGKEIEIFNMLEEMSNVR